MLTVRVPVGVAGLLVSFNTPLPNVAWKVLPSLLCGNGSVLKPSEHTPASAHLFARLAHDCGLPPGVLDVVQGLGAEAGAALVGHPDVDLVSFTGSAVAGRTVNERAATRLAKVCLELGGKNALVVCDDADLELAVRWSHGLGVLQRGSALRRREPHRRLRSRSTSRFATRLVEAARAMPTQPVISRGEPRRNPRAQSVTRQAAGATVLCGGERLDAPGWHLAPTLLEGVARDAPLSCTEVFGPVAALYRARDFADALALVNDSPYGLTAAIHTASLHRAMRFAEEATAGVVVVNGGTHGSEPHMGFGGVKHPARVEGGGRRGARRLLGRPLREHCRRSRSCLRWPAASLLRQQWSTH